jgi:[acyl-carrier-protein] S-malonyltransferase
MSTAALFPGQGVDTRGLRELIAQARPDLLELAVDEVGDDVFERAEHSTACAQPAIYCASLARWSLLERERIDVLAGHSLGELSALTAAGALDEQHGLRLVALRGRLTEQAGAQSQQRGGMLAVSVGRAVGAAYARGFGLTLAADNSPDQVVLAGERDALETLAAEAGSSGVKTRLLSVGGAFHSPAMDDARLRFAEALEETEFEEPRLPLFSCANAAPMDDPRRRLTEDLTNTVRWRETLLALQDFGAKLFVEVGPGRVLTGLVRRTLGEVEATAEATRLPAAA